MPLLWLVCPNRFTATAIALPGHLILSIEPLHRYMCYTEQGERTLAMAAGQQATDDADAAIIEHLTRHEVEEEQGHDELLVKDLACLWNTHHFTAR